MARIRLGVIGAGSWAITSHLPNFAAHGDVEFVAVSRHGTEELKRVRRDFGFAVASEDYRDVLAQSPDLVLVSSPSGLHHEHAKAALQAGAHVLLEKPVTIEPAAAWDLVQIAKQVDRHVVVAFGWNYRPMVRLAKQIMGNPGIGRIEALSIVMASPTRELLSGTGSYPDADPLTLPESATWVDRRLSGGGYGQAQLSHALGMALWLSHERVDGAFALMSAPSGAPVELHDAVAMRLSGGGIGTMSGGSSWTGAGGNKHQLCISMIGSEGQFRIDVEREDLWLFRSDGVEIHPALSHPAGLYDCVGPVDAILDLARGRDIPNESPIELGARTVEALDLIYRSAASGVYEERESK
ncbi:MAG: hypothetical protein BGO26_19060 [Actinobacteria bacterium 69-20]|nr:Gfo/Idh/MocA family oxidoreductase [Actinomycetota bacterium]OJV24656.1 MAG: hypothetical protein BGO26_19060 [Actinobacteria bacterium 69-20]